MQNLGYTPRVNGELMRSHAGQIVRLVGKVVQPPDGRTGVLEASDGVRITVYTVPRTQWATQFIEVVGRVQPNCQAIDEMQSAAFGDDFDLANYEQVVQFSQQYTELFIPAR